MVARKTHLQEQLPPDMHDQPATSGAASIRGKESVRNVVIPGAKTFEMKAERTGAPYQIFLSIPDEPPPASGFPVVYLLDANATFASMVETLRRGSVRPQTTGMRACVVVGIGYPIEGIYDSKRRTFDYTSGSDAFSSFIEAELKPCIQSMCSIDKNEQIIFGHSLAGFFVLDLFCRNMGLFRSYLAASPSIWWDRAKMMQCVTRPVSVSAATRLFVCVGEWEQALPPWLSTQPNLPEVTERQQQRAMIDNAERFVKAVECGFSEQSSLRFEVMKNEDHASVVPLAISHGLRFALSGI